MPEYWMRAVLQIIRKSKLLSVGDEKIPVDLPQNLKLPTLRPILTDQDDADKL